MRRPVLYGVALTGIIIGTDALMTAVDDVVIGAGIGIGGVGFTVDRWRLRQSRCGGAPGPDEGKSAVLL